MDHHKKVLGIIYIITASLSILIMLLVSAFMGTLFEFIIDKAKEEDAEIVLQAVRSLVTGIVWVVTIFVSIPSIIAGIGLLNKQRWALTLALILGCLTSLLPHWHCYWHIFNLGIHRELPTRKRTSQ